MSVNIQAIIFDCFGVLAKMGTWEDFLQSVPADVDKNVLHALNHQFDSGHITRDEFLYRVHDLTGHEPKMLEELIDTDGIKNKRLLSYIESSLKPRHKIGLLSNIASDWVTSSFLTDSEQQLFDDMVFSYQVGMTKPDTRIYQLACQRLSVPPNQAVFVDDIQSNVDGAAQAGLKGVLYRNVPQLESDLSELTN